MIKTGLSVSVSVSVSVSMSVSIDAKVGASVRITHAYRALTDPKVEQQGFLHDWDVQHLSHILR